MEIILRADGNAATGLGHIMRTSALMQMLQPVFSCSFYTRDPDFFPYRDFAATPQVTALSVLFENEAAELSTLIPAPSIVVLDGYQFDTAYQQTLKDAGHFVVCIDDIFKYHFVADVVINHAGGVKTSNYSAESYTRFCLGPQFALVKPLFTATKVVKEVGKKELLVSLGGADPNNDSERVLRHVDGAGFNKINLVVGGANRYAPELKKAYAGHSVIEIHHNISTTEMYRLMVSSPYAVLSPSTVCYEYMSTTGVVFLYQIADNQEQIKKYFLQEGLAFELGSIREISSNRARQAINKQQQVFDGKSGERLTKVFSELQQPVGA